MSKIKKTIKILLLCLSICVVLGVGVCQFFPGVLCKTLEKIAFSRANLKLKKIKVGTEVFAYAEGGTGPTLVFVHGFQGDKKFWLNYVQHFISDYHILIPDMPAHGDSSFSEKQHFDLKSLAKTMHGFMEEKRLKDFCLIGTSLGGGVVTEYAALYPEKLTKLILLNPIGIKAEDEAEFKEIIEKNEKLFFPNSMEELDKLYVYLMGKPFAKKGFIKKYFFNYLIEKRPVLKRVYKDLIRSEGVEKILSQINTPTLVIMGQYDKISRPVDFEIYSKKLPNCCSVKITDGYHILTDRAFEKAVKEMRFFVGK